MKKLLFVSIIIAAFAVAVPVFACGQQQPHNRCWDLRGEYVIDFTCTSGCSGVYTHTMDIESITVPSGAFSGTGYYNADHSYTWNVNGTLTGTALTFTILYTGSNSGYTVNASGAIASDGTLSGTATGPGQTFTWQSISGKADAVRCSQGHFIKWWKDKDWKAWYLAHFRNWWRH